MNWPALPFVRLVLPFGIGIFLGTLQMEIPISVPSLLGSLLFFSLIYLSTARRLSYGQRRWFGVLLFGLLLGLGYLLSFFQTPWQHPQHLRHYTDTASLWQFRIEKIKAGEKSIRLQGSVTAVSDSNHTIQAVKGKLLLYLKPDSAALSLRSRDHLLLKASVKRIEPPKNPEAFDFSDYMSKKGIYHRAFADRQNWTELPSRPAGWGRYLEHLQMYCLGVLKRHLPEENELAIGAALIMGQRDLVSEDIREAYTATGAIHVLAVSGLHVGMIYLGLASLLNILGWKGRPYRWPRSIILIISVWSFALFTGGSASVLRAASMFSFIILGEALYRRQNIYNTLAASAFLLLCIQPYLLLDIGFQLSYLAVIGIVFFQRRIYRAWYLPNIAGNYLWKLACVSIAAQLTTLPISLFYFHQFPLYFWLSGWIVVPAAMIILSLGLALLLFSTFLPLASLLGIILEFVIGLMNTLIFQIQQLPAALLTGVWIGSGIVLLLYVSLFSLMNGLHNKRLRPIQFALLCLIIVGCRYNVKCRRAESQQVLTIYHIYGHTAIDIFNGRRAFCLSDLPAGHLKLQMAVENFRAYHQIDEVKQVLLRDTSLIRTDNFFRKNDFIQIGNIRMAVINRLPPHPPPKPLSVDYLLLRDNADLDIEALASYFSASIILFDASNIQQKVDRWINTCKNRQQICHDLGRKGAWVADLNNGN